MLILIKYHISTGQSNYINVRECYEEMENPALMHFLAVAMYFILV